MPIVTTPKITPIAGPYKDTISVALSCATPDANIYYTTDGSTPDATDNLYVPGVPIVITSTTTIKAKGFKKPAWQSFFDNTKWVPVTYGTWDGSKWNSTAYGPGEGNDTQEFRLEVIGTWYSGFRPTKVRVTHNNIVADLGDLIVYDNLNPREGFSAYVSLSEKEFSLVGSNSDILRLALGSQQGAAQFSITNIEFYGPLV